VLPGLAGKKSGGRCVGFFGDVNGLSVPKFNPYIDLLVKAC
jgi:hypothetical protein